MSLAEENMHIKCIVDKMDIEEVYTFNKRNTRIDQIGAHWRILSSLVWGHATLPLLPIVVRLILQSLVSHSSPNLTMKWGEGESAHCSQWLILVSLQETLLFFSVRRKEEVRDGVRYGVQFRVLVEDGKVSYQWWNDVESARYELTCNLVNEEGRSCLVSCPSPIFQRMRVLRFERDENLAW